MTSDATVRTHGFIGELEPGNRVAGYVLEERIGVGGLAVVFRARDETLGRLAAVKVLASPMAGDPEFRARFLTESRAVAAIKSEHIIPVYGAGEAEGNLYIATQWAAGGDLAALARRAGGFLAPDRAATLVAQVASGLDAAHAAGLVHGDVKPQNILIDSTPELPEHAFLYGFGLGKGTGSFTELTAPPEFVGASEYCAPEQVKAASVDGRADQYALGCVAFALLTGQTPVRRDETVARLYGQVDEPAPSVCMIRPELPPAVDLVIARALAESPADRFARCGEFAAALQAALTVPQPATAAGRQAFPAEGDTPETALPQRESPRHPYLPSSVSPAFTPQIRAEALREGSGHAGTIGGGSGNADTRPPLPEGWESPPKRKRLNDRMAAIVGTVAVALAAAALIYAERPTSPSHSTASPSHSTASSTIPSRGTASPTTPSRGTASPTTQPHSTASPTTQPHSTTAAGASQTASASGPSHSTSHRTSSPGQPGAPGTTTLNSVPGQVTGVTSAPGDGDVALTWQAPQGSPTGYQVEVSPVPAGQTAIQQLGAATSDTITGLTDGTTYTFTVLASNAAGKGPWSLGLTAVPFGKPPAMLAPSAEALPSSATGAGSHTSATVTTIRVNVNFGSLTDDGSPITGYTWYEYKASSSSGPWTEVASQSGGVHGSSMVVPAGVALFDVSNDGSWYAFTATETNAAGESAQSPLSSPAIQVAAASGSSPSTTAAP
jgi:serine/threonine protein kinase